MSKRVVSLLALMAVLFSVPSSFGWNRTGHMVVALIAYEDLKPETRLALVALLKKHPRFNEDFLRQMPASIKDEEDKNRWIFAQAANWPDIARGLKGDDSKYNHPTWHYINVPIHLDDDSDGFMSVEDSDFLKHAAESSKEMNIIVAYARNMKDFKNPQVSAGDRAVALCWILHLVGDVHQPLHTTSLFTEHRFLEGDKGGNGIPTVADSHNLHAIWDDGIGHAKSLPALKVLAERMVATPEFKREALKELGTARTFGDWTAESFRLAGRVGYDKEVRRAIRDAEGGGDKSMQPIGLSSRYLDKVRQVSQRQIVLAGHRLADVLR